MGEENIVRRIGRAALYPAVLFLIVAGFYWKLTLTRQFDWVWGPDLVMQVLPWLQVEAVQWHHHHFPLWDPYLWAGLPMLGQAQPGAAYPLNWILFSLPLSHGKISMDSLRWYFVVVHWMAAVFCYLLCRDLGRSRAASVLGGCIFSFSAYMGTADWPQMINGVVWAPLVFLFQIRALEGRRPVANSIFSGACLGMAWLSGHHQIPLFTMLAWGGVWLYHLLRAGRAGARMALYPAVGTAFAVSVGALQILPAYEYGRHAVRWVSAPMPVHWNETVPYFVHARFALPLNNLFSIVFPGFAAQADPYVGAAALALALLAIACCWREKWVPLWGALALFALVYALGGHSVFQGLLYGAVPMVEKARVASAAVFLFGLGVAVLASWTMDRLPAAAGTQWARRAPAILAIFAATAFTLVFGVFLGRALSFSFDDRILVAPLAALLMAGLLRGWTSGNLSRNQAAALAVMLVVFELGNNAGYMLADRSDAARMSWTHKMYGNADVAEFLRARQQAGAFRIETDGDEVPYDWSEWNGLYALKGFTASMTDNLYRFGTHTRQFRALAGVRYRLGRTPEFPDQREIFSGASGLKVYETPGVFPMAWVVHATARAASADEIEQTIENRLDELRTKALLLGDGPKVAACAGDGEAAEVERLAGGGASVQVKLNCDGMLLMSDIEYPGWKAEVDGRAAEIYEADGFLRGVPVPAGTHRVVFRYRPGSAYAGAALTLAGGLGVALAALLPLTYRRKAGTIQDKNVS